ncbi:DUF3793 family protein [Paratractidigestivibacter sp.]|uniref:DUF3793 family protein n=1 Tax=Paratractidigestivibacter sp. TaxID=2847316 RepID=UPI002ABE255D|nr:DUF3793 family protein [Paratractidigestivibacter sp.]
MGQGIDGIVIDPREASSMEECVESEFVRTLVAQAGLVIFGQKPAAVFGFTPRAWKRGDARAKRSLSARLFSIYARETERYGVSLVWLANRRDAGTMLLAWRPAEVETVLADKATRALLAEVGLPVDSAHGLMSALVARLRSYYAGRSDFPHELGLVLGYPVEDVRGFMADGGRGAKVVGRWRCYGDVDSAERRFSELSRAERACKRLYSEGVPMRELLRMGAA